MGVRLRTVATILAGFAAGGLGAIVVPALFQRRPAVVSAPALESGRDAERMERARELLTEARLKALESAAASGKGQRNEPIAPPVASPAADQPQASNAAADHQSRLQEHEREAVDEGWAASKSEALGKVLGAAAEAHHFKMVSLDCRSATCAATLEWPSYGEAVGTMDDLLHAPNVPCGRQVVLPEPTDATASYTTTVLYHDCS
jgi:hypothetical protein